MEKLKSIVHDLLLEGYDVRTLGETIRDVFELLRKAVADKAIVISLGNYTELLIAEALLMVDEGKLVECEELHEGSNGEVILDIHTRVFHPTGNPTTADMQALAERLGLAPGDIGLIDDEGNRIEPEGEHYHN